MREAESTGEAMLTNTSDDVVTTGISRLSLTENNESKSKAQRKRVRNKMHVCRENNLVNNFYR